MSKAFTKDTDDAPPPPPRRAALELPVGTENYLTPAGLHRLGQELERRRAQGETGLAIDALALHVATGVARPVPVPVPDDVRFGARVRVRDDDGGEHRYRIVGIAEAGHEPGDISWRSPLARALLGGRVGDVVTLRTPRGHVDGEIVAIAYDADGENVSAAAPAASRA